MPELLKYTRCWRLLVLPTTSTGTSDRSYLITFFSLISCFCELRDDVLLRFTVSQCHIKIVTASLMGLFSSAVGVLFIYLFCFLWVEMEILKRRCYARLQ